MSRSSYSSHLKEYLIGKTEDSLNTQNKKSKLHPCCANSFLEAKELFYSENSSFSKQASELFSKLERIKKDGFCPECQGLFLRAAFIFKGSMTDPSKRYHLEINLPSPEAEKKLEERLSGSELPFKLTKRQDKNLFYLKDSNNIEDFLTLMGAQNHAMELMQTKVEKDVKNAVNRINNSDSANIQKTVYFSGKIRDCVNILKKYDVYDTLPENLKKTAALKLKNPGSSISELCLLSEEHITKSGMNHRLQKIIEFAEKAEKDHLRREKN